jgi:ankyrin repeat protein
MEELLILAEKENLKPQEELSDSDKLMNCIHFCCFYGAENCLKLFASLLITQGQENYVKIINNVTKEGKSPLILAVENGKLNCVKMLKELGGVHVGVIDDYNKDALIYAKD